MSGVLVALLVGACSSTTSSPGPTSPGPTSPGPTSAQSVAPEHIRIGFTAGAVLYLPMWVAREKGLYANHNLNVEDVIVDMPVRPLVSGDEDVDFVSPAQAIQAVAQGFDGQIFMTLQNRVGQQLIGRADANYAHKPGDYPGIVQDLKGKTIGVTVLGGAVDFNLRCMLITAGLDPNKDVKIIAAGGAAQVRAAFDSGQLDAFVALQPFAQIEIASGKGISLLSLPKGEGPKLLDAPWTIGFASRSYIASHETAIRDLEAALLDSVRFIEDPANQAEVYAIFKKDVSPVATTDEIKASVDEIKLLMTRFDYTAADFENAKALLLMVVGPLQKDVTASQIISSIQPKS